MKNKKRNTIFILFILVLTVTIGYALLSTTLKINGTTGISKNTWDIHWENVDNEAGITPIGPATIDASDNTEVDFEVDFTIPGEYYEFTVDAVNRGTIDGMFKVINTTVNGTSVDDIDDYIKCTIAYADGTTPEEKDLLAVGKQITYKVKVEYLRTITNEQLKDIPNDGEPFTVTIQPVYIQAKDAVDKGNTIDIPTKSCPGEGCTYFFYSEGEIYYVDIDQLHARLPLTNYTNDFSNDYTDLKKSNSQRKYFVGSILDNENKLDRAFACGIHSVSGLFCVEGIQKDESTTEWYARAQQVLFDAFGEYDEETGLGCRDRGFNTYCEDQEINAYITTDGQFNEVGLIEENTQCRVTTIAIGCSDY